MMKRFFYAILLSPLLLACDKDEDNEIPYVPVNAVITTTGSYTSLNSVGGWAYVPGGSKGIVVYRHTLEEFFAMERHCPYQPANGNIVSVDSTNVFLLDVTCGSKFYMTDGGSVANGPATRPLKRYNVSFDGNITLNIYN